MARDPDKPIVASYADIVRDPPTYVAFSFPLTEVDWMRIQSVDISSALLGAAVTAMLPIVVPAKQYLSSAQVDETYIWICGGGLVLFVLNALWGKYLNRNRWQTIHKIDTHFETHGVGASR
jgi:hypothetical protein